MLYCGRVQEILIKNSDWHTSKSFKTQEKNVITVTKLDHMTYKVQAIKIDQCTLAFGIF